MEEQQSNKNESEAVSHNPAPVESQSQNFVNNKSALSILAMPIAVVIAGALVAGAVLYTGGVPSSAVDKVENAPVAQLEEPTTDNIRPVDADDHIRGNPDAPVKIVEFTDYECPFCQRMHGTLRQLMDDRGDDGDVAWVIRHFPLEQLHSKAIPVAVATECVAELGGNDAFWAFSDKYFEVSPSNNRTDIETVIPELVRELGINPEAFEECFAGKEAIAKVQEDLSDAIETGGRGTPWSVVIGPNGKTYPMNGALPQSAIEQIIDAALADA